MIINFNNSVLAVLPKVDYRVRLLTFLYLSMWFCAFAVFEYALVNMLFRIEARVEKARDKAEAECGIEQCINQRERESTAYIKCSRLHRPRMNIPSTPSMRRLLDGVAVWVSRRDRA